MNKNGGTTVSPLTVCGIIFVVIFSALIITALIYAVNANDNAKRAKSAFNNLIAARAENSAELHDNDERGLQYILIIKYVQDDIYNFILDNYDALDFFISGYSNDTRPNIVTIESQESDHILELQSKLTALGDTPYPSCVYNFSISSLTDGLNKAISIESLSINGYNGVADAFTEEDFSELLSKISIVDGKHVSYLNVITGNSPFPLAFDQSLSPSIVIQLLQPYIVSCSFNISQIPLPISRNDIVPTTVEF